MDCEVGNIEGKLKGFSSLSAKVDVGNVNLDIDGKSDAKISKNQGMGHIGLTNKQISDLLIPGVSEGNSQGSIVIGGGNTNHGTSSDNTNHGTSSATASFATSYSIIMALLMMVKMAF